MQFKNIIMAAALTLATSVFAATSPSDLAIGLQNNIAGLDIGQKQTTLLLNHLSHHTGDVTPDAIVSSYNATATTEAEDLEMMNMMEIDEAPIESVQLVICQAFHGFALSSIEANNAFVDYAMSFNKAQRKTLREAIAKNKENVSGFLDRVASKALPYCLSTIKIDNAAIYDSLDKASKALDPKDSLL
ncbi:uncharacterized protein N7496_004200 [Penicillium cataractarum]|uniref:Uncharacterized protein n=1 Tax=Penicillium cataractarum TaxID=2100454 RepID=A0A9W9SNK3_9EURO|nr:uncharacterized protein N7496_004200 [Penicillium cataractarum]KAJ5381772.1 hypothetical protein N7496_004200 [Penicillium cataractarum]